MPLSLRNYSHGWIDYCGWTSLPRENGSPIRCMELVLQARVIGCREGWKEVAGKRGGEGDKLL